MYSQNHEDDLVWDLLGHEKPGRLLDIGAADGAIFSNSRRLLEAGWSGVLVEPEPHHFTKLHERYRSRPDVQLIHAAVGTGWYLSRFWATPDLVSTTVESHYQKWRQAAQYDGQYWTPVMPLDLLFVDSSFDFVTIDTEGTSAQLGLRMLDYGLCPRVLCVEHDGEHERLIREGAKRGYRQTMLNAENLILARPA